MSKTLAELNAADSGYYDRSLTGKYYDSHVFIAGNILQSAEMNEIQSQARFQLRGIADALFKDGDIVRDCRAIVLNGLATLESGAIYLAGQVRGIATGSVVVPATGTISIGVWLVTTVLTADDDKTLNDPASGQRGYNQPGAYRMQRTPIWGLSTDTRTVDDQFYPVYWVDDGQLRAKEPPPNLDSVTQAIARYDVDSNGSNYVVSGMNVSRMDDAGTDFVFNVDAGRARVNGYGISLNTARRLHQTFTPNYVTIDSEPFAPPANGGTGIYSVSRPPIKDIQKLQVTRNVVEEVTRGQQADGRDTLAQASAIRINSIYIPGASPSDPHQTEYVKGTDWNYGKGATGNDLYGVIDWSLGGVEPAAGARYSVDYDYIDANATPTSWTETTVTIDNIAKNGTVLLTYRSMLPRIDRLVIDEKGVFSWILGVATNNNPIPPAVPTNVLALAQLSHTWYSGGTNAKRNLDSVITDSVHVVSMSDIEGMNQRMDTLTEMIAQLNLVSDVNTRDNTAKRGLFVDPFTSERNRDASFTQSAAVTANSLQLPIKGPDSTGAITALSIPTQDVATPLTCAYTIETVLGNEARTGDMKVNPYLAFSPFPAQITLSPAIDRWVRTETNWLSAETRYFTTTVYAPWSFQLGIHGTTQTTGKTTNNELVSSSTRDDEYLRQIDVAFTVTGFAPNEELTEVTFDNLIVTPSNP